MTNDPQAPVRVALSNLLHAASRLKIMGHPIDELDSVLARRINEAGIALSTPQERLGGEEVAGMAQELRDCMDGTTELLDKKGNSLGFKMALPSGYQRIEAATFAAAELLERLALQPAAPGVGGEALFAFLTRKYVQRADDRQREMGLQYTEAETHDLAKQLAQFIATPGDAQASASVDRDYGGRLVREAWVRWALTQPNPKPTWLVPYDELSEPDKEADRQIAEALWSAHPQAKLGREELIAIIKEHVPLTCGLNCEAAWEDEDGMYGDAGDAILARTTGEGGAGEATRYAETLAIALAKKVGAVPEWRPLSGDMIGLLTQIDNMTCGLTVPPDKPD